MVYVNPAMISIEAWDKYVETTKARMKCGEEVNNLVCHVRRMIHYSNDSLPSQLVPLSRHSTLAELQEFVKLFRPQCVVPNTLDPRLLGLDWKYIDRIPSSLLPPYKRRGRGGKQVRDGMWRLNRLTPIYSP